MQFLELRADVWCLLYGALVIGSVTWRRGGDGWYGDAQGVRRRYVGCAQDVRRVCAGLRRACAGHAQGMMVMVMVIIMVRVNDIVDGLRSYG